MNQKQVKFAERYILTGNGTQSAIDAGYSPRSAHVAAARLLKNDKVIAYIADRRKSVQKRTDWDLETLIQKFENIHDDALGGEDHPSAIRALENIGKLLGLYVTKHTVDVPKPIPHFVAHQSFPFDLDRLPPQKRSELMLELEPALIEHDGAA